MTLSRHYLSPLLITVLWLVAGMAHAESPYAGQQLREIKALSSADVNGYLNGHGMGYAKAAELNSYPGPRHVLELSKELGLDPQQIAATTRLFESMQARAIDLGTQLVAREQELDHRFAERHIDAAVLQSLLEEIGDLNARLRYTHLQAHLAQTALLSPEQVQRYNRLRGYQHPMDGGHDMHQHGH